MPWDLVIFDLDGTLLDTIADLGAAVDHAMLVRGFPTHTTDEYKTMVGHGVRNLVRLALPEGHRDEATVDGALADFTQWYESHIAVHTRPYPGIPELLHDLSQRGVKLAVASNKFQEGADILVRQFFPDIPFIAVFGNKPGLPLKPDAEVVRSILRIAGPALGGARGRAVMVGDSLTDIHTARAGGIAAAAVAWGYRPATALAGEAGFVAADAASLRTFLLT